MRKVEFLFKKVIGKRICLGIIFVFCLALVPGNVMAEDGFKVTLLGTGMPVPNPARFGPSTLVEAGGQRLLFDMGRGCTIRLWQKQIALGSIDAHFLTHLHSDHINGLSDLWLSGWIQTPFGGRKSHFLIYGPKGTKSMMSYLWKAFSEDRRIRLADEKNPIAGLEINAHDFKPGVIYEKNGVVKSFLVKGSTQRIKAELKQLGGKWNSSLGGWIFPKSKEDEIRKALRDFL